MCSQSQTSYHPLHNKGSGRRHIRQHWDTCEERLSGEHAREWENYPQGDLRSNIMIVIQILFVDCKVSPMHADV